MLACSLEAHGSHPIGRAILKYARAQGLEPRPINDFLAMSGQGIQGRDGEALGVLGRRELLSVGRSRNGFELCPNRLPSLPKTGFS